MYLNKELLQQNKTDSEPNKGHQQEKIKIYESPVPTTLRCTVLPEISMGALDAPFTQQQ